MEHEAHKYPQESQEADKPAPLQEAEPRTLTPRQEALARGALADEMWKVVTKQILDETQQPGHPMQGRTERGL